MKNRTYFSTEFILSFLTVILAGCTLTVRGKYIPDENDTKQQTNNMVDAEDLGVGFDRIYMDPADLSINSVQGRHVRPRVFEFKPDPNPFHTIDIPRLGSNSEGPVRRNMVLGVEAETNPRFEWAEEASFIYSSNDYRNLHESSFSGSAGVEGIASFSGSASFKNVQESTRESQNMYVYKDGVFRGHTLALAQDYPHELTADFKRAVGQLSDPASYDHFILNWGTHYSQRATMGAKCGYRLTFNHQTAGRTSENSRSFSASVSAGIKQLEFGFGASDTRETISKTKESTKASEIKFVSYGGSGAGTSDFGTWSEHATLNSTLIDVYLMPYTELLNSRYFPSDPLINQKRQNLADAYVNYYENFPFEAMVGDSALFHHTEAAKFKVELVHFLFDPTDWLDNDIAGGFRFGWVDAEANYTPIDIVWQTAPIAGLDVPSFKMIKQLPSKPHSWDATFIVPNLEGARIALLGVIGRYATGNAIVFPYMHPGTNVGKISDPGKDLGKMTIAGQTNIVDVDLRHEEHNLGFQIRFRVTRLQ
ncbi:MAG: MAC/perforin domain-containing protein [bacterium]